MATATATPRRLRLREDYTRQPGPCRVDRDKGVIFDVKVCGADSDNNRRYLPECFRDAVSRKLYEGAKVHADHPLQSGEQRPVRGILGKLVGIEERPDGLWAKEFHILKSHPLADSVFEDCERGLGVFGLSHNADAADWTIQDGVQVISKIDEVFSVDLVSDPATNSNLWEGRTPMKKTFKQLLEAALKVGAKRRAALLREADEYGMSGMEMEEPPAAETDPKALLGQAVAALVQSADDADHELAAKVMKLLKPEAAGSGGGGGDNVTEEDDEPDEDDKPKEGKKRQRKSAAVIGLTEAKAKSLCVLGGIEATKEVLEAVVGVPEEKALSLLALLKGKAAPPVTGQSFGVTPRSLPAGTIQEGKQNGQAKGPDFGTGEDAGKKRLAFLRG